jgi:hypothetical protein
MNETTEFPITCAEFVEEVKKPETAKAFLQLMKVEGETAHRTKTEWEALLVLFQTKPCGTPWKEWSTPAKPTKSTTKEG